MEKNRHCIIIVFFTCKLERATFVDIPAMQMVDPHRYKTGFHL